MGHCVEFVYFYGQPDGIGAIEGGGGPFDGGAGGGGGADGSNNFPNEGNPGENDYWPVIIAEAYVPTIKTYSPMWQQSMDVLVDGEDISIGSGAVAKTGGEEMISHEISNGSISYAASWVSSITVQVAEYPGGCRIVKYNPVS